MSLYAPTNNSDFTPAPSGVKPAICCDIVDLGILETPWGNKHKIFISWLLAEFNEEGLPFIVSKRYTLSMHEKSNLYADVSSWLGIMMTPDQAERCDLEKMIGRPCLLNIVHTHKDGTTYADVKTIMPLPDGSTRPEIGDYKRHIDRSLEENPRDVRNPHLMHRQQPQEAPEPVPTNGSPPPAPPPPPVFFDDDELPF